MGNIFIEDFIDFLKAINQQQVEYILVGGYSVILYGYSRTTGDMDILVNKTKENYQRLQKAFHDFKMPVFDMTEDNFLHNPHLYVFTFGRQPVAIDIMTSIKGATFDELYLKAIQIDVDDMLVKTIHVNDLILVKKASGRYKDLDDLENIS